MKLFFGIVAVSLSSFALGCSSSDGSEAATSNEDLSADVSADKAPGLTGTYERVGTDGLAVTYTTFDFQSGGKVDAYANCPKSAPKTCDPLFARGSWKLSKDSKGEHLALTFDGKTTDYFVSIDSNTLTLNKTISGATEFFYQQGWTKKIGMGDVCQDAAGKSLGECADDGNFGCGESGITDGVYTCNPLD